MQTYDTLLLQHPLFEGIQRDQLHSLLSCLNAYTSSYQKGDYILQVGEPASHVGILLEGTAQVVRDDIFGNRSIITSLQSADTFAEVFACANTAMLPVSVFALQACTVLWLDYKRILNTCPNSCIFHKKLIENMLQLLAQKNLQLNQKIETISARTTREKLFTYLSSIAQSYNSTSFTIPFNRQELADYLSVDRSAMSTELGKMRDEGYINFHKNTFTFLKSPEIF